MAPTPKEAASEARRDRPARRSGWVAAAILAVVGTLFLLPPLDGVVSRWSYDLGFQLRAPIDVRSSPIVIVSMDDDSQAQLGQPGMSAWDRRLHALLIRKLKDLGARVVAFDVLFRPPYVDTNNATQALLLSARDHGRVVFAAKRELAAVPTGERSMRRVIPPDLDLAPPLVYGLAEETDEDRTPREHGLPLNRVEPLSWEIAKAALEKPPIPATRRRWVNFYGPAEFLAQVSYASVLSNTFSRSISFSNKVVFVGSGVKTGYAAGSETDHFRTPYSERFPGVALNATVYLNLYRGDWLTRIPALAELAIILLVGALAGMGFSRCPALWAIPLAVGSVALILYAVHLLLAHTELWFSWIVPAVVQIPAALLGSAVTANLRLTREKRLLARELHQRAETPVVLSPAVPSAAPARTAPPSTDDRTLVTPQNAFSIPNYSLIRRIGKGAYGEVWIAKNAVGLLHAVKIVHRQAFEMAEPFEREFRGVQSYMPISLGHPGLVPVLYVGRDTEFDCFYYVMELADDADKGAAIDVHTYIPRSLDKEIERQGSLPARQCLQVGLRLAETLAYLHEQRLVHRDIKPSNVIFVKGQPKFADLGLVTRSQADRTSSGLEHTATYVGTKGYIPPEGSGTAGADVYALGKVLYQMAWGRGEEAFPSLPTDLESREDQAELMRLNPIILRACEPNSLHRYRNAQELRDALQAIAHQTTPDTLGGRR